MSKPSVVADLLSPEERRAMKTMGEFRITQLKEIRDRSKQPGIALRVQEQIDLLVSALTKLGV